MNLIGVLISGVRGAENGSVELYRRGTSNRATWYNSFEGDGANASGASIALDANGGVEVYVDELVDVVVKAVDGSTVRSFTAGDSSPPVEVRSQSFTGTNYATAASAAGNPTTLQAVLNLWLTNNGSIDWKVLFNNASTTIKAALSMLNGKLFYNVKEDAFGAQGNGTTDDRAAIQAAVDAAEAAGGGIVFFPRGTYRVTAAIDVPAEVHLIGVGGPGTATYGSILTIDHASNNLLNFDEVALQPQLVIGLLLKASQTNTGKMITGASSASVQCFGCTIGDGANTTGDLVSLNLFVATKTQFKCAGSGGRAVVESTSGTISLHDCHLAASTGAYSPTNGMVISHWLYMNNCIFDMSVMSSGTARGIYTGGVGSSVNLNVTHCTIGAPGGGTVHLFNFSSASITHLTRIFEDYNQANGSSALYAVNATPFTGDATAAASPGTPSWNCHLGSRERRLIKITHDGTPFDLNTLEYGFIILKRTTNAVQTLTANAAVPNGKLTIMIDNESGGAGGNITTGAGFYPGETFSIATNLKWDVRTYRGMDMLGNMRWLTDTAPRNNI